MISTERLLIKKVSLNDADSLFKVWSNDAVTKYMNIDSMTDASHAEDMIKFFIAADHNNEANRMGIFLKENEEVAIGSCGFNYIDFENDRVEIGYELHSDYWRKGYMKEALKALIYYVFETYNVNRIEAKVDVDNIPSQKLLENIGFEFEGVLRGYEKQQSQYIDIMMYSILNKNRPTTSL